MSNKNSLKYQFKKQLAISIGLLVIIFSFLLYKLFFIGIGSTMHRTMMSMANHYVKQIELNRDYDLPQQGNYSAYIGKDNVPKKMKALFNFDEIHDFQFQVNEKDKKFKIIHPKKVFFFLVHPIPNNSEKLYLFYHEIPPHPSVLPPKKGLKLSVPLSIALITLIAISLVYLVANRLIRQVLNPLNKLAHMAESIDENNLELSFDVMNDKTEIGVVANTLHQSISRVHQYHQREKQFLQNASHELRTPIAIVSSALEIIELRTSQGKYDIFDQHTHIRRANKDMSELTEALLLLSRGESTQTHLESVNLEYLISSILEEYKYLIKGKNVEVELHVDDDSHSYDLPMSLCRIILRNLIRNAFEHTISGTVFIEVMNLDVTIINTSLGLSNHYKKVKERGVSKGKGFGIGLDIVHKISSQQKWPLHFSSDHENDSQVTISFIKAIV